MEVIIIDIQSIHQLETEIDYQALSEESKLDYDLLVHFLDLNIFSLNELAGWTSGTSYASSAIGTIGEAVFPLFTRNFAALEVRVKAIISRLKAIPQYLEELIFL